MALLPGSSISTSTGKRDEHEDAAAQRRRNDTADASSSPHGSPPPPYRPISFATSGSAPVNGVFSFPTTTSSPEGTSQPPSSSLFSETMRGGHRGCALPHPSFNNQHEHHHRHGRWGGLRAGRHHHHGRLHHGHPHQTVIADDAGNASVGGRRCGRSREQKRRFFRRVLLRFIVTFSVAMMWLHFDDVRQAVHTVMACMPSFVVTALHMLGVVLYAPISVSQTFGVLLYSALAAFLITAMHVKIRHHRRAKWHSRWTEAARARHAALHDREAFPDTAAGSATPFIHHHDHHQRHHPHGTPPSFDEVASLAPPTAPFFMYEAEVQSDCASTDLEEEKSVASH